MIPRPPISPRTYTLFPYPTLFRSPITPHRLGKLQVGRIVRHLRPARRRAVGGAEHIRKLAGVKSVQPEVVGGGIAVVEDIEIGGNAQGRLLADEAFGRPAVHRVARGREHALVERGGGDRKSPRLNSS